MYWLFKEEPTHYSFDDLVKDGRTIWSGVHNPLALKYLREVKKDDQILYYHTGSEKQIVGLMRAAGDSYSSDGRDKSSSKEIAVEVVPIRKLSRPVTLHLLRDDKRFTDFLLVKISRLSVMPVSNNQWKMILAKSS
jgi:predicted RNA-binding protein with PUA-like domain